MKRLLVLLLVLTMLIPTALPVFSSDAVVDTTASETVQEEVKPAASIRKVVASLSDYSSISKTGLKPSTEQSRSGSFTALLDGELLSENITVPVTTSDFSQGAFLEVPIYSAGPTDTTIGLLLMSDNPQTPSKDYYLTLIKCKFQGWKLVSVSYDEFEVYGTPAGLDSIDSIQIIPGFSGTIVDSKAKLYIDDISIVSAQSAGSNVEAEILEKVLEPFVIWDAEREGVAKGEVVEIDGKMGYKWGPGDEALAKGPGTIYTDPAWGLSKYRELVIEMYSVKNTGSIFSVGCYGEDNPNTSGTDWYWFKYPIDWENEWKEVRVIIQGGEGNQGNFSNSREPLWSPPEAEFFTFSSKGPHGDVYVDTTEVYVSKIYFDGDASAIDELNPNGDLIYSSNFDPETMVDYVAMVKEKHPRKQHPRLLVTDEIIDRIDKYKETDSFMKAAYEAVKRLADKFVSEPPPEPLGRMSTGSITVERNHLEDVTEACGLMYLLTGQEKYAQRIWDEIVTVIECDTDWVRSSNATGLDGAHITCAMGLAYDWLYDWLTDEQKQYIRNGTMKYALYDAGYIHNGAGYLGFANNVVGATSKGYVSACLAWCDEPGYSDFVNHYLNSLVKYLPSALYYQYQPDGFYSEGIGYWSYATLGLAHVFTNFETAIGSDCGLIYEPAIAKTAYMPFGIRGPRGAFDFSDSTKTSLQYGTPLYFFLDEKYDIPAARAFRLNTYEKAADLHPLDLIWYNPEHSTDNDWRSTLPKDYFFGGLEPVISMRTSYEPDAYFIAGKGGNSRTGHDQYDAGSFVIDALGVRWIEDTGAEVYEYDTPSIWRYRIRPEGNNCLFVDPTREWTDESGWGQTKGLNRYDTMSTITASGAADGAAYGIVDNAPSYQETLSHYERGFALVNNRTQFIVRDEIETIEPYEVYSYYHTTKGIDITSVGKNSYMMETKDGKMCKVDFISDIKDFETGVMEAEPHPNSPRPGPEHMPHADNKGFHKFYFRADGVTKGSITVVFTPMLNKDAVTLPEILPLSEWDKYLENSTALTSISVDGLPLGDFNPGVGSYNLETEKIGIVTATAGPDVTIQITQATKLGETAKIVATNATTGKSFTYKVNFGAYTIPGITKGIEHVSLQADRIPEPQNPPENMFDGNLGTRFAVDDTEGNVLFTMELAEMTTLTGFSVSFYNGHTRKNKFDVEVSEDNENWIKVFEGFTPGDTDALVAYTIEPNKAKFVRFRGYGCYGEDESTLVSQFNSITEFVVYGDALDFADTQGHWAQPEIYFARNYSLVEGVGDNTYMPENPVTRAEFITMMVRACNFEEVPYEEGTYNDVTGSDWYSTTIMAAKEKGIIPPEMVADGFICPTKYLTREEMCAIASLAVAVTTYRDVPAGGTTSIFTDIEEGPYTRYIDQAIGLRIVNGMTPTTFAPKANITRAQAAAILRRTFLKIFNINN